MYGNAEPVHPRQARPDDDVVVIMMKDLSVDPRLSMNGGVRLFKVRFEHPDDKEYAISRARDFVSRKQEEGFVFVRGDIGYWAKNGQDYTRTGSWELNPPERIFGQDPEAVALPPRRDKFSDAIRSSEPLARRECR
jgi:hypothetical protein